ncbi:MULTISPECIES: DUF3558 domain-containing protein [unclassified Crossiella]|uniref:DUF3558 domain-containing protein n=1 Tax=unclassified Crossiella TaxID=2620835 RepID=UPI001FFE4F96|nr:MULTISPECIES: DUF3558 domain-containing protein [unclassified Crossiella]MCK2239553.1 DUF3558 domain-containing protein [Crossiella sp. S99.2]MCK2252248.1 DUF3558 domain-containing protein [Crossiella sp. S99.1]
MNRTPALGMAAVLFLAGCAVPGSPVAMDEAAANAAAKAQVSARPSEIRLDGFAGEQVCSLLTAAQQKDLGVDYVMPAAAGDRFDNRGCRFSRSLETPRYAYRVTPVTQEGADVWLRPGETNLEVQVVRVAGFPAVQNRRRTDDRGCFVDVSVADGQRLGIQYSYDTHPVPLTAAELCGRALAMAELAVRNLVELRGRR